MNNAHDEDGIIDLRALASTPPSRGAFAMPAPFMSEPPPAFSRDADESELHAAHTGHLRRSKAKTVGIVFGTAAFLALCCVGVGLAFRGAKVAPPSAAAAVVAPPAPPPVVTPPAPAPAPSPAVITASVSTDEPAEAPSPKKGKGGKARGGAAKAATKATASPAKASSSKASDPCNCHGDFQCNIRCAASK